MYKIITIVSARPQFIKAVVLSRAIGEWNKGTSNAERGDYSPYWAVLCWQ